MDLIQINRTWLSTVSSIVQSIEIARRTRLLQASQEQIRNVTRKSEDSDLGAGEQHSHPLMIEILKRTEGCDTVLEIWCIQITNFKPNESAPPLREYVYAQVPLAANFIASNLNCYLETLQKAKNPYQIFDVAVHVGAKSILGSYKCDLVDCEDCQRLGRKCTFAHSAMPHDAELLNSPKNKTVDFYDKYAQGSNGSVNYHSLCSIPSMLGVFRLEVVQMERTYYVPTMVQLETPHSTAKKITMRPNLISDYRPSSPPNSGSFPPSSPINTPTKELEIPKMPVRFSSAIVPNKPPKETRSEHGKSAPMEIMKDHTVQSFGSRKINTPNSTSGRVINSPQYNFTSSHEFDFPNSPSSQFNIAMSSSPTNSQASTQGLPVWKDNETEAMRSRSTSLGSSGRSEVQHRERSDRGELNIPHSHAHSMPRRDAREDAHKLREKERPRSGSTLSTSPTVQFQFDTYVESHGRRDAGRISSDEDDI